MSKESTSNSSSPVVVGYGINYYQNMGPATRTELEHDAIETTSPVTAYQFLPSTASSGKPITPWEQDGDDELVDVQCTITSSYFLTKKGKIYTCGTLHGNVRSSLSRTIVTLPLKCVQIATGRHFGIIKMEGGLAVCSFGAGHFGQLGLGSESSPFVEHPTVIESLLPHAVGSPIASVAAGYWHSMALTQEGVIFSFGCNRSGQCGMKPTRDPPTICSPRMVKFDNISSSNHRTATPSSSATSTSSSSSTSSYSSSKVIKIEKIVAGRSHSVALDHTGQGTYLCVGIFFTVLDGLYLTTFALFFLVYCWGANNYGQCGLLSRRRGGVPTPKHVEALAKVKIVDVAAGEAHTLSLTGGGRVL